MIPDDLKSYVCIHVSEGTEPVRLINRGDGDWCFLSGGDHENNASNYRVVGIGHVLQDDPSLRSELDLPPDWESERKDPGEPWIRMPCGSTGS
jgi:hypothetical protein